MRKAPALACNIIAKVFDVAIEFREPLERRAQRPWALLSAKAIRPGESDHRHFGPVRLREAGAADLEVQVIVLRGQQYIVGRYRELTAGHHAFPAKLYRPGRTCAVIRIEAVPDRDHQAAVARNDRSCPLQLPVSTLSGMVDIARAGALRQAQLDHIAHVAKTIEDRAVALGFEVFSAQAPRVRQQRDDGDPDFGGGLGHQQVRSRGHRTEQTKRNVGVIFPEPLQHFGNGATDLGYLFGHQVAVTDDPDHERNLELAGRLGLVRAQALFPMSARPTDAQFPSRIRPLPGRSNCSMSYAVAGLCARRPPRSTVKPPSNSVSPAIADAGSISGAFTAPLSVHPGTLVPE